MFKFLGYKSSFMLSIRVFSCLPLLLLPLMLQCNTQHGNHGNRFSSIFSACLNHLKYFFGIFESSASFLPDQAYFE